RRHTRFSRDWSSDVCSSDLLQQNPLVGFTLSPADFIKRMHQVLSDNNSQTEFRLPDDLTQPMLAQYFLLYENANGQDLWDVVDRRFANGRILAVLHSDRSSDMAMVIQDLRTLAADVLPAGMTLRSAGYGDILVATTDAVVWGQIQSLLLAVI